ncbi:hypothetical protein [Streptomyces purpurogeneiscleroticus]|uniref:hypothetical protein n=1 Tax=Streptomyces purpurogeneiscleroticus TaxID=68259 RepID=UPI001CBB4FD6|nr:hypothetical protein [Streptomyces purpurogeneiscleroticus]
MGYRSHRLKLERSLEGFARAGAAGDVFVAGAGKDRPQGCAIAFWDDDAPFMWHKERLVNLAAGRLPSRYTHIVWVDSDVVVGAQWITAMAEAFRTAKVVQGFRNAYYRTEEGRPSRVRVSALRPGADGTTGLVWGACRSLFSEGPGLFELALVGSGDAVFACGVLQGKSSPSAPWCGQLRPALGRSWSAKLLTALGRWETRLQSWLQGEAPTTAHADVAVLEHGPLDGRKYAERHRLLASLDPREHLVAEDGRVLQWTPAGLSAVEPGVRAYFHGRREDDPDAFS